MRRDKCMLMVLPSPVSRISALLEEVRQTSPSRGW